MFGKRKFSVRFHKPVFTQRAVVLTTLSLGLGLAAGFADGPAPAPNAGPIAEAINRAIDNEHALLASLGKMRPVVETYIQEQRQDPELGSVPLKDHYFLGRLDLSKGLTEDSYIPEPTFRKRIQRFKLLGWTLNMSGWARFAIMDYDSFDKEHYRFSYVKREFLGEVRCLVFDIAPKPDSGSDRFKGRIWVEDQSYHIVRFNGSYGPKVRGWFYVHFDSWRVNSSPGVWLPACAYAEESDLPVGFRSKFRFKAQVRYWGYQLRHGTIDSEYTNLTVDQQSGAKDITDTTVDNSPVTSTRLWERQAEDNALDRLERGGFLAPKGDVDHVLETVLNNIEVTNGLNIEPEVRVRLLLTTPLESFTVGHTIVVSRGLLDVLPDEASLAAMLSFELAHIALGHQLDTKYAFTDRLLFEDDETLRRVSFARNAQEEDEAEAKAIEYLHKSPYAAKLAQTGLFLRQLSVYSKQMPNLIRPLLGDSIVEAHGKAEPVPELSGLMGTAPALRDLDTAQVTALPLGSRIKLDPWSDQLTLMKTQKVALLTQKEKLPFEVTPFMLHLSRLSRPESASADLVSGTAATGSSAPESPRP